jgi:hypothetical protein
VWSFDANDERLNREPILNGGLNSETRAFPVSPNRLEHALTF